MVYRCHMDGGRGYTLELPTRSQPCVHAPCSCNSACFPPHPPLQVLLYLLLMEDRYRTAVRTGLLWNINSPTLTAVRYTHGELASLLMHRNRLAAALATGAPPPPLQVRDAPCPSEGLHNR